MEAPHLYKKYHLDRDDERIGLFEEITKLYSISNALYPGSFVHIAPSLVIPDVTYVDSYKKAQPFFDDPNTLAYIACRKQYSIEPTVTFLHANYQKPLPLEDNSFDLLISQYGGFISLHCKRYLKPNGLLVANNSHGDAGLAFLDKDFELISVINKRSNKYHFSDKNLDDYFIPKKRNHPSKKELIELGKGIGYLKTAGNYLFRKKR